MSRPKIQTAVAHVTDVIDGSGMLAAAQNQMAQHGVAIVEQFGDGLPFDALRYEDKIRGHLSRSAEEMLAAGRALLVVKEHLAHGEWKGFLERISLEESIARRMSQAALKFSGSNRAISHGLVQAAGSKSKLFELMVLDDEEIQELNDGGTVAGLELDDVARMPVSELRKTLREHRAEAQAAEEVAAKKSARIDKLETELAASRRRIQTQPLDEAEAQLRREFGEKIFAAENALRTGVYSGVLALRNHGDDNSIDYQAAIVAGIAQLQTALDNIRDELSIAALTADADGRPAWAREA